MPIVLIYDIKLPLTIILILFLLIFNTKLYYEHFTYICHINNWFLTILVQIITN